MEGNASGLLKDLTVAAPMCGSLMVGEEMIGKTAWARLRMGVVGVSFLGVAIVCGGAAPAPDGNDSVPVAALPGDAETRPVVLSKVRSPIQRDKVIGPYGTTLLSACVAGGAFYFSDAHYEALVRSLNSVLDAEARGAGFKTLQASFLFGAGEASSADYQIGASIRSVSLEVCSTDRSDHAKVRGFASYAIDWEIFSKSENRLVATVSTSGTFRQKNLVDGPGRVITQAALRINVRKLLASEGFRKAFIVTTPASAAPAVKAGNLATYFYSNLNNGPSSLSDGVGAVVAIFADGGFGSGFLVGSEGLLLTNQHVVGTAKYVKVRWADGLETVGEVLRTNPRRDVALVKTDPRGRTPLKLSMTPPVMGDDVFAIGTPLEEKYQSTMTRGIVSANRVFDGFSYIQSDVAVNEGNSGGPLLDKNANVVGITVSGTAINGATVGLNLFIPLRDAFDFLALQPAKAAAPQG